MIAYEHVKLCARTRLLEETQLLTVSEVALRLRQSDRTVRDKIASGSLPAVRIGEGPRAPIRVDSDELERFIYGLSPLPGAPDERDAAANVPPQGGE